ncbi:MAG: ABC transporter substrate-binding protein, partial [bacterium]|nr:ABC transporter substrate-binding protein [bacterium]
SAADPATSAAASATSAAASGEPIDIGAVVSLTGPAAFPEASAAASAYFDALNASGGVNGRPIRYTTIDDGGDPAKAAQAAQTLIDQNKVVALAGGASLLECAVNAQTYAKAGLMDIPGTGVDPGCFASSNISPVNTGPYTGTTVSLYYLSEVKKVDPLCYIQQSVPAFNPAFEAAVAQWTKLTGKELAQPIQFFNPTDDAAPILTKLIDGGCKAIFLSLNEAPLTALLQAANAQGVDSSVVFMSQSSGYTEQMAKVLGQTGQGLLANSEFLPFTSSDPALDEWRDLMTAAGVPLTSFSQGGYLAAQIISEQLKTITGPITAATVRDTLLKLTSYPSPFIGNPYSFGPGDVHASNVSSQIVELNDGAWTATTGEWVSLPPAS